MPPCCTSSPPRCSCGPWSRSPRATCRATSRGPTSECRCAGACWRRCSYVDPDVPERVLDEGALLEGVDVEATVMVVDMRDFTPFAERSSAQETVARLNELFEVVVPVVLEHGGHANKFLGDGVLAVFGAPERFSDHADRAVSAGVALVEAVNRHFAGEVHVGVGINAGPVVVGSVGGGGRL